MSTKKAKELRNYLNSTYKVQNVPRGTRFFQRHLLQLAMSKMAMIIPIYGLPASLPRHDIEASLIVTGNAVFVERFDMVWCPFNFKPYGSNATNVYNQSIQFTGSNPVAGTFKGYDMVDGVIAWNTDIDKSQDGMSLLWEVIQRYAAMLAHCESTIVNSLITKRTGRSGVAMSTQLADAVNEYMDMLEVGDTKTIQATTALVDELKSPNFNDQNNFADFTQLRDYLVNCFLNEIGLQTLEEKKERMITSEVDADAEMLNTYLYSYLNNRYRMVQKLNAFFGLNLSLAFRG